MVRLKELREERGWTMKDAAQFLKKSYTTYVNHEKGYREPDSDSLVSYSRAYGVSIDYLLGRTDIRKPAIQKDDGQKEKYEELKLMLDQLSEKDADRLKDYLLYLLQRQQSPDDQ